MSWANGLTGSCMYGQTMGPNGPVCLPGPNGESGYKPYDTNIKSEHIGALFNQTPDAAPVTPPGTNKDAQGNTITPAGYSSSGHGASTLPANLIEDVLKAAPKVQPAAFTPSPAPQDNLDGIKPAVTYPSLQDGQDSLPSTRGYPGLLTSEKPQLGIGQALAGAVEQPPVPGSNLNPATGRPQMANLPAPDPNLIRVPVAPDSNVSSLSPAQQELMKRSTNADTQVAPKNANFLSQGRIPAPAGPDANASTIRYNPDQRYNSDNTITVNQNGNTVYKNNVSYQAPSMGEIDMGVGLPRDFQDTLASLRPDLAGMQFKDGVNSGLGSDGNPLSPNTMSDTGGRLKAFADTGNVMPAGLASWANKPVGNTSTNFMAGDHLPSLKDPSLMGRINDSVYVDSVPAIPSPLNAAGTSSYKAPAYAPTLDANGFPTTGYQQVLNELKQQVATQNVENISKNMNGQVPPPVGQDISPTGLSLGARLAMAGVNTSTNVEDRRVAGKDGSLGGPFDAIKQSNPTASQTMIDRYSAGNQAGAFPNPSGRGPVAYGMGAIGHALTAAGANLGGSSQQHSSAIGQALAQAVHGAVARISNGGNRDFSYGGGSGGGPSGGFSSPSPSSSSKSTGPGGGSMSAPARTAPSSSSSSQRTSPAARNGF